MDTSLNELLKMESTERAAHLYREAVYKDSGKRLPKEYEEFIKIIPRYAYKYAYDVINNRWLEAENNIKKHKE